MFESAPYQRLLQESLREELRIINAHLPREQKSLSQLLEEADPGVDCSDDSRHLFKRKELTYLAGLLENGDQAALLLPIIIEVSSGQHRIICRGDVESKVVSKILNMPLHDEHGTITIYKPQLAVIRRVLKTTTQYLFSARV